MVIFEIESVLGKKIRITEIQWFHITLQHKEINNQIEKILQTLSDSDSVLYDNKENTYNYYKFYPQTPVTEKYMLVIVKHINAEAL